MFAVYVPVWGIFNHSLETKISDRMAALSFSVLSIDGLDIMPLCPLASATVWASLLGKTDEANLSLVNFVASVSSVCLNWLLTTGESCKLRASSCINNVFVYNNMICNTGSYSFRMGTMNWQHNKHIKWIACVLPIKISSSIWSVIFIWVHRF